MLHDWIMKEQYRLTIPIPMFSLLILVLLGGALFPKMALGAGGGYIRVATSGNDTPSCGSDSAPCRTIQYAVNMALTGSGHRGGRFLYL